MKTQVFEEHAEVLAEWWKLESVTTSSDCRTLICFDAHLDLQHISPERIARLRECETADEIRSLAKPHHLLPDAGYSYSIEDFLYAASQLGIMQKLIWVAPPHVNAGFSIEAIQQLQQTDGVTIDDLTSFRRVAGGWLDGQLLGLEICICDYRQLAKMALPVNCLIDIDIDFFVEFESDQLSVAPQAVVDEIRRLSLHHECITISRSFASGFTPPRYRFLADYLAANFEGRKADANHFQALIEIDADLQNGKIELARQACNKQQNDFPECRATRYFMTLVSATFDLDRRKPFGMDVSFDDDPAAPRSTTLRAICECLARPNDQATALRLLTDANHGVDEPKSATLKRFVGNGDDDRDGDDDGDSDRIPPADKEVEALINAAMGMLWCRLGNADRAEDCHRKCEAYFGGHPELSLEIAQLLGDQPSRGERYLENALQDDKTRTTAKVLLAQIRMRTDLDSAIGYLRDAQTAAPAWIDVLTLLAVANERSGQTEFAVRWTAERNRQRMLLDQLAERIK